MNRIQLIVYFEDPFWVAVFERQTGNAYTVARRVFGAEPSEPEVYHFILRDFSSLEFSRPLKLAVPAAGRMNPKRRQREARRAAEQPRPGTKAQEALQREYEASKQERRERDRQTRDATRLRKYLLRREKRKQKHLGH